MGGGGGGSDERVLEEVVGGETPLFVGVETSRERQGSLDHF